MKRKLLVMGGSYMNLQMKISPKTEENDRTLGYSYCYHPYGDDAIAAVTAAKLGADCTFATKFGDDKNGKRLYEYYKNCGVRTDAMTKDASMQTGMCVTVWSDLQTHKTYLTRGASAHFTREEAEDAFSVTPDLFLVPSEEIGLVRATDAPERSETEVLPAEDEKTPTDDEQADAPAEEKKTEAFQLPAAKESLSRLAVLEADVRQIEIFLPYTSFTSSYPLEKLRMTKAIVLTDERLAAATGAYPDSTEKTVRALTAFAQKIPSKYYLVRKSDGSVFVYDGRYYEICKQPAKLTPGEKRDCAESDPVFMGALVAEYAENKNILRATRFAMAAALVARGKFGALEKMSTRDELEAYAAENGISWDR